MLDRLLRLEIKHSRIEEEDVSLITNQFNDFVGSIYEEYTRSSVTGTLLPIPSVDGHITWHVLTCAHVLDMIGLSTDYGSVKLNFLKPKFPIFPIKTITIFKKNINIGSDDDFFHNTVELNDTRAVPRYDSMGGDVALCRLDIDVEMSTFLKWSRLILEYRWINDATLNCSRYVDHYRRNKMDMFFHFVNNISEVTSLVASINEKPKNTNFVFGLAPSKSIILSRARRTSTEIFPSNLFIDPQPPEILDELCFFHDAPTCKGMSGGAIFQIADPSRIDVFGVVKGCKSPRERNELNVTRCVGLFLQKQLLLKELEEEKDEIADKRVSASSKKRDDCIIS